MEERWLLIKACDNPNPAGEFVRKGQSRLRRPAWRSRQAAHRHRAYAKAAATVLKIGPRLRGACFTLALPGRRPKVLECRVSDQLRDVLVLDFYILGISQPAAVQFIP